MKGRWKNSHVFCWCEKLIVRTTSTSSTGFVSSELTLQLVFQLVTCQCKKSTCPFCSCIGSAGDDRSLVILATLKILSDQQQQNEIAIFFLIRSNIYTSRGAKSVEISKVCFFYLELVFHHWSCKWLFSIIIYLYDMFMEFFLMQSKTTYVWLGLRLMPWVWRKLTREIIVAKL